jgi:DNA-binding NarL/FixJ family response regulator
MRILLPNQDPSTRSSLGILFKAQSDLELVGEPSEVSQLASDVQTHNSDVVSMSVRTEERQAVIDMGAKSTRLAVTIGDNPDVVVETGLYNVTEKESGALIHFDGSTQNWTLVRMPDPQGKQQGG